MGDSNISPTSLCFWGGLRLSNNSADATENVGVFPMWLKGYVDLCVLTLSGRTGIGSSTKRKGQKK